MSQPFHGPVVVLTRVEEEALAALAQEQPGLLPKTLEDLKQDGLPAPVLEKLTKSATRFVGKEEDFEKPLTAFGKVTVLSLKPGG